MSKHVLITGAGGFIGTHLVERLKARGDRVSCVLRNSLQIDRDGETEVIEGPPKPDDYRALLGRTDAIVWLASTTTPSSSANGPVPEVEQNLAPFLTMLGAIQSHPGCHLVYVSTGGAIYGDVETGIASEDSALNPKSYYSAGKAAIEQFISAYVNQFQGTATILRPSNIYGPGQAYRPGFGIIPTAFHALLEDKKLDTWGNPKATRDYLFIEDFISLCERVIDRPEPGKLRRFHASSGTGVSLADLVRRIEAVTGRELPLHILPRRSMDVSRVVLDNSRTAGTFGWSPQVSLEQGLARTWEWFKAKHA